jgi:hypothetical protein
MNIISELFQIERPELHFIAFTENSPTSVAVVFKDAEGLFRATIYQEGEKFFANCDGMMKTIDGKGYRSSSLSGIAWEFDLWLHVIFEGAVITHTRLKWTALEREYWKYLKTYQPEDLAFFRKQYLRETSVSQRPV